MGQTEAAYKEHARKNCEVVTFDLRFKLKGPLQSISETIEKPKFYKGIKGAKPKGAPEERPLTTAQKSSKGTSPFLINKPPQ
jgi:hypothetical protein